jgi:UDP-N-acetylglucosamine acyltransferase
MATKVHPTAIVEPGAELGENVEVGPYCCIGSGVKIGAESKLRSHVVVAGRTTIGDHVDIFPFASIGQPPQDLKYGGELSTLVVGSHCCIREYVTMNPGTEGGGMVTSVGDHCLFMVGSHVAHDCQVGNHVILANNAALAGHVEIGDHVIVGGNSAVHQFARIGEHAMIGGMTGVENDVIPYGSVMGERGRLSGLNIIGLKRHGFTRTQVHNLRSVYKFLFSDTDSGTVIERLDDVAKRHGDDAEIMDIVRFIRSDSSRGLTQPKNGNGG